MGIGMRAVRLRSRAELEVLTLDAIRKALGDDSVIAVELKPIAADRLPNWRLARTTPPLTPQQWLSAFDAIMPLTLRFTMKGAAPRLPSSGQAVGDD